MLVTPPLEPRPPLELSVESICVDRTLCSEGYVQATWKVSSSHASPFLSHTHNNYDTHPPPPSPPHMYMQIPSENLDIFCPVLRTLLTYTITELGVPDNSTSLSLPPDATNFTINPLMPGTSYVVQVSYINEVGESENSTGTY